MEFEPFRNSNAFPNVLNLLHGNRTSLKDFPSATDFGTAMRLDTVFQKGRQIGMQRDEVKFLKLFPFHDEVSARSIRSPKS